MKKRETRTRRSGWRKAWRRRPDWLVPSLGLALLAAGVYANALFNGFVSDDNSQLLNNPLVTDYRRIPVLFRSSVWGHAGSEPSNYYRPLQLLLYMGLYYAVGFRAYAFHLLLVLVHVADTLLVYRIGRRCLRPGAALIGSALFAVHPIHTEAVDWIAALPDLLVTFFVLLGIGLFMRQEGSPKGWQVAGHSSLYLLALFSKETGATLLPLYAGYEWLYLGRRLRDLGKNLAFYGSLLLTFGLYLLLRYAALGALAPAQTRFVRLAPREYFLSAVVTVGGYFWKLVVPTNLNYWYVFEPTGTVTPEFVVSLLAVLAALATIPLFRRRNDGKEGWMPGLGRLPVVSYGVFWTVVALAPVLNLTGLGSNVFAERYLYLPSVGFVWLVAVGWDELSARWGRLAWGTAAIILAACSVAVFTRNPDWHDDMGLLIASAKKSPNSAALRTDIGLAYLDRGDYDAAIAELSAAAELKPDSAMFHRNLGAALSAKGRTQEAMEEFRKAVQLNPRDADAHYNLGHALQEAGDGKAAATEHVRALVQNPEHAGSLVDLGLLRFSGGDAQTAILLYRRAIAAKPDYALAYVNLGVACNQAGQYTEAVQAFRKALELGIAAPDQYVVHYNLGISYRNLNALETAAREFRHSYQLRPDFQAAQEALAKVQTLQRERQGSSLPQSR